MEYAYSTEDKSFEIEKLLTSLPADSVDLAQLRAEFLDVNAEIDNDKGLFTLSGSALSQVDEVSLYETYISINKGFFIFNFVAPYKGETELSIPDYEWVVPENVISTYVEPIVDDDPYYSLGVELSDYDVFNWGCWDCEDEKYVRRARFYYGSSQEEETYEPVEPQEQEEETARKWTVIILLDGDNNLDSYAKVDIDEMREVFFPPEVKLVALADFYQDEALVITSDDNGGLVETPYGSEPDMADVDTLYEFILSALEKYPAEHTALVFWNHGDGWRSTDRGAAFDETSGTYLTMNDVVELLERLARDGYSFDFIGFDECLMAGVEVFADVAPYTEVVVASEALEPGNGWDYTLFLGKLAQNPDADGITLGEFAVDAYAEAYGNTSGLTLISMPSDKISELVSKINDLTALLSDETYESFKLARENATEVPGAPPGYMDLYSFVSSLDFEEARDIAAIIDEAYKYTSADGLNGVYIFFPMTSDDETLPCYLAEEPGKISCFGDEDYYNPFAATSSWDEFLVDYYGFSEASE
jgi:hypothetical protein